MKKRRNLPRGMNQRTIQGKVLLVDRRASSMSDLDQVKVILRTEGATHFSHSDLWNIFPLLMQITAAQSGQVDQLAG